MAALFHHYAYSLSNDDGFINFHWEISLIKTSALKQSEQCVKVAKMKD